MKYDKISFSALFIKKKTKSVRLLTINEKITTFSKINSMFLRRYVDFSIRFHGNDLKLECFNYGHLKKKFSLI